MIYIFNQANEQFVKEMRESSANEGVMFLHGRQNVVPMCDGDTLCG